MFGTAGSVPSASRLCERPYKAYTPKPIAIQTKNRTHVSTDEVEHQVEADQRGQDRYQRHQRDPERPRQVGARAGAAR